MTQTVERVELRSRSAAAHSRAAELVDDQRRLNDKLDAFFRQVAEVKDQLRAEGSLWDGPVMDPPVEAAFAVWSARGPVETRVELSRLAEPPMMDLEPQGAPRVDTPTRRVLEDGYPDSPA